MLTDPNEHVDPEAPTLPDMPRRFGTGPIWPYDPNRTYEPHPKGEMRAWQKILVAGALGAILVAGFVIAGARGSQKTNRAPTNVPAATYIPEATITPAMSTSSVAAAATESPSVNPTETPAYAETETPASTNEPSPTSPPATGAYPEVQRTGAYEFTDYRTASRVVAYVNIGQIVTAECIIYDPNTQVSGTGGLWYRSTSGGYIATDTFWNQSDTTAAYEGYVYDPSVPACTDSPSHDLP